MDSTLGKKTNDKMATATDMWLVRSEDGVGEGRLVDFRVLAQGITDGAWSDSDQARGPQDRRWMPIGDHPQLQEFLPLRPLFTPKAPAEAEMDMTPMIDVTFQLIIFFMITATFVVQKTLDMPESSPEQEKDTPSRPTLSELAEQNIIVRIHEDGGIAVDDQPVELAQLPDALREASRGRDNVELILDVDDEVEYEIVVRVIDGAAGAQIEKVHFVRRAAPPEGAATG
jgi:biopolymer transport protein ExbD